MKTMALLRLLTGSLVIAVTLAPQAARAQAQRPAQLPRRSPQFQQRDSLTNAAARQLREATASNWRLIGDDEVGTVLWADFTAGLEAMPGSVKAGSSRSPWESFSLGMAAFGAIRRSVPLSGCSRKEWTDTAESTTSTSRSTAGSMWTARSWPSS